MWLSANNCGLLRIWKKKITRRILIINKMTETVYLLSFFLIIHQAETTIPSQGEE